MPTPLPQSGGSFTRDGKGKLKKVASTSPAAQTDTPQPAKAGDTPAKDT